jgi:hypothetical protein
MLELRLATGAEVFVNTQEVPDFTRILGNS